MTCSENPFIKFLGEMQFELGTYVLNISAGKLYDWFSFKSALFQALNFFLTLIPSNLDKARSGLKALKVLSDLIAPSSE